MKEFLSVLEVNLLGRVRAWRLGVEQFSERCGLLLSA
jgi:hypothetical protein